VPTATVLATGFGFELLLWRRKTSATATTPIATAAASAVNYFNRLSYQLLQLVIQQFNLTIPTTTTKGTTQLVFESGPATRFRILKLVDDDYLRSSMTSHGYEVNSKSEAT
jgi:hypothetical protein